MSSQGFVYRVSLLLNVCIGVVFIALAVSNIHAAKTNLAAPTMATHRMIPVQHRPIPRLAYGVSRMRLRDMGRDVRVFGEISAKVVKQLRDKTGVGMMQCKKALSESDGNLEKAEEYLRAKGIAGAAKKASRVAAEGAIVSYIHAGSRLGVLMEVNCETDFVSRGEQFKELAESLAMQVAANPGVEYVNVDDADPEYVRKETEVIKQMEDLKTKPENIRDQITAGRVAKLVKEKALLEQPYIIDPTKNVNQALVEAISKIGENIKIRRFTRFNLGEGIEKKQGDLAKEVEEQTMAMKKEAEAKKEDDSKAENAEAEAKQDKPKVAVSAKFVKQLRDKTGAGMMDCKKALAETDNDIQAAEDYLRKKGIAGAAKKAGRTAAEGLVVEYIHPGSRMGVLLELNCETDFVARGEKFQELANNLAMQVAANPDVQYVSLSDANPEDREKEFEIEMNREDLATKPENIRAQIVKGRVEKIFKERALLEQDYIMDNSKTVEQAVKEAIATIGENIVIRRFQKFKLGEGIAKREDNFAEEVAAQMGS
ncbi:hypothetical protein AAMO2058_001419500 [Amorphochlora amoebiformis]|uniref:Elongation factor Ts, mitochondrial n=1 Tax=Amorphochlora amoebiformis TaxID=1561963 RepID=A0A7S0D097_9EUKA|mmetsp:Transcript_16780/g.26628  ORF Transcript_16780/g.26628 Transcript_16780/m.26628 type:complete len:540 (+) Transcript_16780:45-1664(+)